MQHRNEFLAFLDVAHGIQRAIERSYNTDLSHVAVIRVSYAASTKSELDIEYSNVKGKFRHIPGYVAP